MITSSLPEHGGERLLVQTRLGELDVAARELIRFPAGLPGFEDCRRFVLVGSMAWAPLQCLQAVDPAGPSFLVIDPRQVLPGYRCQLTESDRRRLGAGEESLLLWLAIVTLDADEATVNLRAPVVINPGGMIGYQIVPRNALYPLRHPFPGTAAL